MTAEFAIQLIFLILLFVIFVPTIYALIWGAPYVPTPNEGVKKMLKLASLKKGQKTYELGCGDARLTCMAAKKYNTDSVGFELSPLVIMLAKLRKFFSRSKANILYRNFYEVDLSDADAIFCYLLPGTMDRLAKKFEKELKKGTKIISYAFPIKDWKVSHRQQRNRKKKLGPIWVYEYGKHK